MTVIKTALKEWAEAIEALAAGNTILLLRKGGIRESDFRVTHHQVLLYPTYEHQKSELLKSGSIKERQPPSPDQVTLALWGHITDVLPISETEQLEALMPHHIWTETFASERLKWKPKQPLSVLLLRAYTLQPPAKIPCLRRYSGCRSWIEVEQGIEINRAKPVLTQPEYSLRSQQIKAALQSNQH